MVADGPGARTKVVRGRELARAAGVGVDCFRFDVALEELEGLTLPNKRGAGIFRLGISSAGELATHPVEWLPGVAVPVLLWRVARDKDAAGVVVPGNSFLVVLGEAGPVYHFRLSEGMLRMGEGCDPGEREVEVRVSAEAVAADNAEEAADEEFRRAWHVEEGASGPVTRRRGGRNQGRPGGSSSGGSEDAGAPPAGQRRGEEKDREEG